MAQCRFSASIINQPQQEYRFRFVTENTRSILYSRQPYTRSRYVTACVVTDAEMAPYVQGSISVVVSTVSSEGLIHPYFLVGSGCDSGVFRGRFEMPSVTFEDGRVGLLVELRDVAIFCVKRNHEALKKAIGNRLATREIPFHHQFTAVAHDVYTRQISLLESVHLAFVFHHEPSGQYIRLISEAINRQPKSVRNLLKPLMMPDNLPLVPEQKAWLHIEGLARAASYNMWLANPHQDAPIAEVQYNVVRPNLLELMLKLRPEVQQFTEADRVQCELHFAEVGANSSSTELAADVFFERRVCPQCHGGGHPAGVAVPSPPPQQQQQLQQQQQQPGATLDEFNITEFNMGGFAEFMDEIAEINGMPPFPMPHQYQLMQQQQQQQQ